MPIPLTLPAPIDVIFIDLDGVLADFHRAIAKLYGLDPNTLDDAAWAAIGEWGLSIPKPGFWERVRDEGEAWWRTLPALPWAARLWAACKAACPTVVVLTTPGPFAASAAGKWAWVDAELRTHDMLIGGPKHVCSRPGAVLIDDRQGYAARWEAAGGTMIGLARPWNPDGHAPDDIIAALVAHSTSRPATTSA